jgi:hypothetical protein
MKQYDKPEPLIFKKVNLCTVHTYSTHSRIMDDVGSHMKQGKYLNRKEFMGS